MEILLIIGFAAAIALPLHLLNRRDADKIELASAMKLDPRLRIELMCARDYQEGLAEAGAKPKAALQRAPRASDDASDHREAA